LIRGPYSHWQLLTSQSPISMSENGLEFRRARGDHPADLSGYYLDALRVAEEAAGDVRYGRIDTRPRVRVYGCRLPLCLRILAVFIGTATFLGDLVIRAL
jgi:hypothetical protein